MSEAPTVVAVVVTWNRCELLREALGATFGQTRPADRVVVVDNASTDGTSDLLRSDFPGVEVVTTPYNTGGAGGFALGIERAVEAGPCDLVWLMDDDTVPQPSALAELLAARSGYPGPAPVLVASRVLWTDGREHPMNTPRSRPGTGRSDRRRASEVGCVAVRSASFVSVLVDAAVVRARGLPLADYFLWNDDFEFTTRLVRGNVGLSCHASVVVHKTKTFGSTDVDPGPRFYYEVRNKVWVFTRSRGLSPVEKVGYAGATLLRWCRTVAASSNRRLLLGCLGRGLVSGLRAGPRPTSQVLAAVNDQLGGPRG